jgi:hypothetical protein
MAPEISFSEVLASGMVFRKSLEVVGQLRDL